MVDRFDPTTDSSERYQGMQACPDGDWVSYDDYKALLARLQKETCDTCAHNEEAGDMPPCCNCKHCGDSMWEPSK